MCVYLSEIEDVVTEFVNGDTMFTAWDVTVAVRKRSKDRVQHFEVKKEVHRMFDQGGMPSYNRQLANLPGINPQPWLYYPPSADPNTYTGKPAAPAAAAPSVVALPSPSSSMSTVDDDDAVDVAADGSVVYKFDTTDRLCVPNKLVRELGLKEGDEVDVVSANGVGEVCVVRKGETFPGQPPHVSATLASLTVDRYDNVRIGRTTLTKGNLNGVAFEIERDNTAIKVKKYA